MDYFKLRKGVVSNLLYFQEIQLTYNDRYFILLKITFYTLLLLNLLPFSFSTK